ncbi:MAG: type II secretion system protein [Deltaproteobacteria bacterium]|nr:type II secretion system protein [Deltaproteobacteria bacterium]
MSVFLGEDHTLIELLICLAIMGILAAIALFPIAASSRK